MRLLCLDIGNTSGHLAKVVDGNVREYTDIPTAQLTCASSSLERCLRDYKDYEAFVFCSVVPQATAKISQLSKELAPQLPMYELSYKNCLGLPIDYPEPQEIGPDRLACAIGAQHLTGVPAVILVLGTATCFDVITHNGYSGGIIAPGLALMTDYLHEKTALLPKLDRFNLDNESPWGKSTVEAMQIGCGPGYLGMIESLLKRILSEVESEGETAHIIVTGGNAHIVPKVFRERVRHEEHLSVLGLAEVYRRSID